MAEAILLTGSNEGDSMAHLLFAVERLSNLGEIKACSSFYQSSPYGYLPQNDFLNQVLIINTSLEPFELLTAIQHIEHLSGRKRQILWGPRTLDIDILYYDKLICSYDNLVIPHPQLHLRRFTLVPLVEILPELIHPILNVTQEDLLNFCQDEGNVAYFASCKMP